MCCLSLRYLFQFSHTTDGNCDSFHMLDEGSSTFSVAVLEVDINVCHSCDSGELHTINAQSSRAYGVMFLFISEVPSGSNDGQSEFSRRDHIRDS